MFEARHPLRKSISNLAVYNTIQDIVGPMTFRARLFQISFWTCMAGLVLLLILSEMRILAMTSVFLALPLGLGAFALSRLDKETIARATIRFDKRFHIGSDERFVARQILDQLQASGGPARRLYDSLVFRARRPPSAKLPKQAGPGVKPASNLLLDPFTSPESTLAAEPVEDFIPLDPFPEDNAPGPAEPEEAFARTRCECGAKLKAPIALLGSEVGCPRCGARFTLAD